MRKSYKKQILYSNIEKFNLMVIDDIDIFFSFEKLTEVNKNTKLQFNSISGIKKFMEYLK